MFSMECTRYDGFSCGAGARIGEGERDGDDLGVLGGDRGAE